MSYWFSSRSGSSCSWKKRSVWQLLNKSTDEMYGSNHRSICSSHSSSSRRRSTSRKKRLEESKLTAHLTGRNNETVQLKPRRQQRVEMDSNADSQILIKPIDPKQAMLPSITPKNAAIRREVRRRNLSPVNYGSQNVRDRSSSRSVPSRTTSVFEGGSKDGSSYSP